MSERIFVWFNGAVREAGPLIDIADRGFLLGDGAFETALFTRGALAFWGAHRARLERGLAALGVDAPDLGAMPGVAAALAEANAIGGADGVFRLTVTSGAGGRGLAPVPRGSQHPTMLATLHPAPPPRAAPLRLIVSSRRRWSGASTNGFKAISGYTEHLAARAEALAKGADDALMLNERDEVVCATAANVFVLSPSEGSLLTPRAADGATPGVVRGVVMGAAAKLGLAVAETTLRREDAACGRLILTNSLIGVVPARLDAGPEDASARADGLVVSLRAAYEEALRANAG